VRKQIERVCKVNNAIGSAKLKSDWQTSKASEELSKHRNENASKRERERESEKGRGSGIDSVFIDSNENDKKAK
jgi:hypothetical protein